MSVVSIADHPNPNQALTQALDALDLQGLFTNKVVAVKPNETWASARDCTAVTQADNLETTLAYIKRRHSRRLIAAGGAGACETEDVFRISGMMDAVKQQEAEFVDLNRPPFTRVKLDYGPEAELVVNPIVNQIEVWVSLALLKVHGVTKVTLAMKNMGMSLPAADYYGHPRMKLSHASKAMSDFIIGVVRRFPISLAIITGHPAMVDRGPTHGRVVETGLVIASRDAVAADAVGAAVLGFDPLRIRHIAEAGQLGLGEADLSRIEIRGLSLEEAVQRFRELTYKK